MSEFHTPITPILLLDLSLLTMMLFVAFAMLRSRHLFAVVMLSGIYSLLSAAFFVSLDAVDVAFTEAAVGAGVSTVLMAYLLMPLFACRKWEGTPTSREGQTLKWVRAQDLRDYPMPAADIPLIPVLRDWL